MEAEAAAIRASLEKLDELEALLDQADQFDDCLHGPLGRMRQVLVMRLRDHESALWTLAGLPEVPRGRP